MDSYLAETKSLLDEGADPTLAFADLDFIDHNSKRHKRSNPALMIKWKQPLTLKLLLNYGAEMDNPNGYLGFDRETFHSLEEYAIHQGSIECLDIIKEHRARLEAVNQNQNLTTQPKVYDPAVLEEFKLRINGRIPAMREKELLDFLQKGLDPNGFVIDLGNQRWTLLGILSYYDRQELVKIALEHGANPFKVSTSFAGKTGSAPDFAPSNSMTAEILRNHIRNHPDQR